MGRLVVIEGLDGAGKRTLVDALSGELGRRGASVRCMAFPRYDTDVYGPLLADALHGRVGDLTESVYGMAVLFALDRHAAVAQLRAAVVDVDVVLVDRYVASNAAYGAARLRQGADGEFVEWIRTLELDRFDLPPPALQLLLRVPREIAAARAARREADDATRTRDTYESDDQLQHRCALLYDALAAVDWLSPWHILDGSAATQITQLADLVNPQSP